MCRVVAFKKQYFEYKVSCGPVLVKKKRIKRVKKNESKAGIET